MRGILIVGLLCVSLTPRVGAVGLSDFLDAVRTTHPYFDAQALRVDVEEQRALSAAADENWQITATPQYTHDERATRGFASPDEVDNVNVRVAASRPIWSTGGDLELAYEYNQNEQKVAAGSIPVGNGEFIDVSGPSEFFDNAVSVSYSHPLLRNRGGSVTRLAYDIQKLGAEAARIQALENGESFLEDAADAYLDWVLMHEELRIASNRVALAREQVAQSKRKVAANAVDKVDLYRSESALLETEKALVLMRARMAAQAALLSNLAGFVPTVDRGMLAELYVWSPVVDADRVPNRILAESRVLAVLEQRDRQLARELGAWDDQAGPALSVVVNGGLKDGDEQLNDALGFDRPSVGLGLIFQHDLGESRSESERRRALLEREAVSADMATATRQLSSAVTQVLVQLKEMGHVLKLGAAQVATAAEQTHEEQRLYDQGRNELTFVIQSRDSEALLQLSHARNAVSYQKLRVALDGLRDTLLPDHAGSSAD